MQIRAGSRAVATAGTPVQLKVANTYAEWLIVQNNEGNITAVVIGDTSVDATEATRVGLLLTATAQVLQGPLNLADIWVDAITNGDQCHFIYLERG